MITLDQNAGGKFYQDEYMYTFEAYITSLQQVYTTIKRYRNVTAPETIVQCVFGGIRVTSSLVIVMAKENILNNSMGDWFGAGAHMSIKFAMHFLPCANGKRKKSGDFL